MASKIIRTQVMVLLLSYVVFCININDFKIPNVDWVNPYDKFFFGFLLLLGFGVAEGVGCFYDFLETVIPKLANKSSNRYIKNMVLHQTGRVRVRFLLLLTVMVVISILYSAAILLPFLASIEVLQPFFESLSEDFITSYCMMFVVLFYMFSMITGKLLCYFKDARENDIRRARSESPLMMLRNMGRVTDEELNQLREEYENRRRR